MVLFFVKNNLTILPIMCYGILFSKCTLIFDPTRKQEFCIKIL